MSQTVATFATIFFSMILVNNYVLVQFLGICPFLGVSKKLDSSVGMGAAVIAVMVIATAVTFPLQIFLLDANGLGFDLRRWCRCGLPGCHAAVLRRSPARGALQPAGKL